MASYLYPIAVHAKEEPEAIAAGFFFGKNEKTGGGRRLPQEGLIDEDVIEADNAPALQHFARLMTFKNVLITAHQAFLTETALQNIAATTIENLNCFEEGRPSDNELLPDPVAGK